MHEYLFFVPEIASEGFLLSAPSPGGGDRAPREVPANRKTNKNRRFFNILGQATVGLESTQSRPKVGPKLVQSRPKVGPKLAQSRPKVGPKLAQSRAKVGPKLVQSWSKVGPKLAQGRPKVKQIIPNLEIWPPVA